MMIGQSLVHIKRENMREDKEGKSEKEREEKEWGIKMGGEASMVKAHYMSIKCCHKVIFARFWNF